MNVENIRDRLRDTTTKLRHLSNRMSLGGGELVEIVRELDRLFAEIHQEATRVSLDTIAKASAAANETARKLARGLVRDIAAGKVEIDARKTRRDEPDDS